MKKVILGLGIAIGLFSCGTPAEKVEVASDSTVVDTVSFDAITDTALVVADTLAK